MSDDGMPDGRCAHMRVVPFREEKNGTVFREWWACESCRQQFLPIPCEHGLHPEVCPMLHGRSADTAPPSEEVDLIINLVSFIRRLVRQIKRHDADNKAAQQAMDYLRRKGFYSSVLREDLGSLPAPPKE